MVVAEAWAEQRVLMRAFARCRDQVRPTVVLAGAELPMGPAGLDAHGPWGIHVHPPVDGRAQELRAQLELAARRLAGSKGNPPRLMDEEPSFDHKATSHWDPRKTVSLNKHAAARNAGSTMGSTTVMGYAAGAGAQFSRSPTRIFGRTMPHGLRLTAAERAVVDALAEASYLTARDVARIAQVSDGAAWMGALMAKLAGHGLDVVSLGEYVGGEPTYVLRR